MIAWVKLPKEPENKRRQEEFPMVESRKCSSLMAVSARDMDDEKQEREYHLTFIRGDPFVCMVSSSSTGNAGF